MGGRTKLGNTIYVGRAVHNNTEIYPCSVIPAQKAAYIATAGESVFKEEYEVLCGDVYFWDRGHDGEVPSGSLIGGQNASNEQLFIGRASYNGGLYVGTIDPSRGQLFIPYEGGVMKFPVYDVMCVAKCHGCNCFECVIS